MSARDRQDRLAGYLARHNTTVAAAAARFEVSERTLHRDLAALRARGLDVRGDPGRGGGLRLVGFQPRPVQLAVDEIVGLYLSVQILRQTNTLPYAQAALSAVDKLVASLPQGRAKELRQFLRRIVVGRPASATVISTLRPPSGELLSRFEQAFSRRRAIAFRYLDRQNVRTERRAELHGLLVQAPAWYALALDLDKREPRMFRVDRMSRVVILEQVEFTPQPASFIASLVDPAAYPPPAPRS
jgi:predicted DNA-binding transcriptional regulator YafY